MKILKSLGNVKNKLIRIGNKEPLNFLSILLIIALDIFVIFNLFQGLDRQTRQLTSPQEKVPYQCVDLIRDIGKNNNKINFIESVSRSDENRYYSNRQFNKASYNVINENRNENIISECKTVYNAAIAINKNDNIKNLFQTRDNIRDNIRRLNSTINDRNRNYDTMLLERIAGQEEENSIIVGKADRVKAEIDRNKNEITRLNSNKTNIENQILADNSVKNFLNIISQNREKIKEIKEKEEFWYPLKKYGIRFLFVLPLFLLFWFLYKRTSRKKTSISSLIFAHLLVVTSIPIIFGLFEMIFNILPFHFFADFFAFLEAMNLAAAFNYILIIGGILVTLFLVYIVQKKLFSKQKTYLKRISKKKCPYCSTSLRGNEIFCYECGERQYIKCLQCGELTHQEGLNCMMCGAKEFKNITED